MGQLDNQATGGGSSSRALEQLLQTVSQDLKGLQRDVIGPLSQDVARLQAEKARLLADIEKLQTYHQSLQNRQQQLLSQQERAQQQLWAKQLAQALATHLYGLLAQRITQGTATPSASGSLATQNGYADNAQRLLASLDSTFSATFKTLQQELNSYQSSLSQQLGRMHNMEQQGEAILEALIATLREQLQAETARKPSAPPMGWEMADSQPSLSERSQQSNELSVDTSQAQLPHDSALTQPPNQLNAFAHTASPQPSASEPRSVPLPPPPVAKAAPPKARIKEFSSLQLGLGLVLLSTIALSIHNIVVRIIGRESLILGLFKTGGFIQLGVGNSLLILWLRMLVVLPLMVPVAMVLYPPVWRDIRRFVTARDRKPLFNVVASGLFLFLSQILIYIAIGQIGPGPAVTILFMYPIIAVPLAWLLFGDRPTWLRWTVMGVVALGVVLTALPSLGGSRMSGGGVIIAVFSGVAFALYLIFMQLGFKKLHPIPVSLIQFTTIFLLSLIILAASSPAQLGIRIDQPTGFIVGGVILGVLTLVGYLTNNFGVRFMGAARASIVASSGPVATALLAFLTIGSQLQVVQWLGILLVTLGVAALSFERLKPATTNAKPAPPRPAR